MRTTILTTLLASLACLAPSGSAGPAEVRGAAQAGAFTGDLLEEVQATIDSYDQDYRAWSRKVRAATGEEQQALLAERPDAGKTAKTLIGLVQEEAGGEAQWLAVSWAIRRGDSEVTNRLAQGIVLKHFVDQEGAGALVSRLAFGAEATAFAEELIQKTTKVSVRGRAIYSLATLKSQEMTYGQLSPSQAAKLEKEVIALFESLAADEYADLFLHGQVKLSDAAKRNVHELKFLVPGKRAPDIVGEDLDGTPFKLSDYRGKVVLLDFWGDW